MTISKRSLGLLLAFALANGRIAFAATDVSTPAANLAKRIAAMSGPGPAKVTVKNRSSLTTGQVAEIRKLLDRDLRGLGVINQDDSHAEGSSTIRITLSTNAAGGLWIAEVQEGTDLHVAMLAVQLETPDAPHSDAGITLTKTLLWRQKNPVLDLLVISSATTRRMIVLEPEHILPYIAPASGDTNAWQPEQEFTIAHGQPFPRDMRGRLFPAADHLFMAYLPGVHCSGDLQPGAPGTPLALSCEDGDDPWPMTGFTKAAANVEPDAAATPPTVEQRAFYNSGRNYFTGVLSPGANLRLQPFYSAVPTAGLLGPAMLFSGINGKFELLEDGGLKRLMGTRDWGSDLASIRSGCASGTQIVASAAGSAANDSLRAYEISGRQAIPVSSLLDMEGRITAIWPTPDAREVTVIVGREAPTVAGSGASPQEDYEVYRVTAHCN